MERDKVRLEQTLGDGVLLRVGGEFAVDAKLDEPSVLASPLASRQQGPRLCTHNFPFTSLNGTNEPSTSGVYLSVVRMTLRNSFGSWISIRSRSSVVVSGSEPDDAADRNAMSNFRNARSERVCHEGEKKSVPAASL